MKVDNTYSIISRINTAMNELIAKELKINGIEGIVTSHGSIIMSLLQHKELSMNDLAEKIGKTPQTVTTLVQKLISMGYVEKKKSESDRRTIMVNLTEKGREFEPILVSVSEKIFETQYEGMSKQEVEILRRLLLQMESNFIKQ